MEIGRVFGYGYKKVNADWPHGRSVFINRLYHIHSGKGHCRHNGKDYKFTPGKLYFIPDSDDLKLFTDVEDTILHSYMDFDFMPPIITNKILSADITDDPFLISAVKIFDDGAKFMQSNNMVDNYSKNQEQIIKLCNGAVTYIISHIVSQNNVPFINDREILRALDIIHSRLSEPLTVESIAGECYLNKDSFIRRFSKHVGTTPYAYIKRLRILTARRLRADGMSLAEVALQTGYSDASSLLHALNQAQKQNF